MIDTHAHLYQPAFETDRKEVIQRAMRSGIEAIILPNINLESVAGMLMLQDSFPNYCYAAIGLHPCDVKEGYDTVLRTMKNMLDATPEKFIAIGETGIDLYWRKDNLQQQIASFRTQAEWCQEKKLPIIIHARESSHEIFRCLKAWTDLQIKGVWHCFSGSLQEAEQAIEKGLMLGIGGVSTFKGNKILSIIKNIGLEHILLETDAPYLAPAPYRGKRNEPAYIPCIVRHLATELELLPETIIEQTNQNALRLFERIQLNRTVENL